jgi:dTDP-4-dehydrorhamnose 3,5-epimerase
VNIIQTSLEGVLIIEPKVFEDARGFFFESYNKRDYFAHGIREEFVQDNVSRSGKGTLRGLHYQLDPVAQGKLVRVSHGAVFDVAVDIRRGSPTFARWFGCTLTAENRHALYVPPGFAHAFLVLSDEAEFTYKCTALYDQVHERAIAWNDPQIGIAWPMQPNLELLSNRDRNAPMLGEAEINFVYQP